MALTRDERFELYTELKKKELRLTHLAERLNCSHSLLSQYFNNRCNISHEKEIELKRLINQAKEYKWMKVEVE
jgi:transcriptional regulator with XRE-family HTH domain